MHHIVLDRWSRGGTAFHQLDPRAKIVPLLVLLIALATAQRGLAAFSCAALALIVAALLTARIPIAAAFARAAIVLPFTLVFALTCWLSGDLARGEAMAVKSYVSALAVLTVVATTPLPSLLRGLELLRIPSFLLTVTQFVYRYLFVISEEGQHMSKAAAARGAAERHWFSPSAFRAAAGALGVLFARSYGRAAGIHDAMLARGFHGHIHTLSRLRFRARDAAFASAVSLAVVALRLALERIA